MKFLTSKKMVWAVALLGVFFAVSGSAQAAVTKATTTKKSVGIGTAITSTVAMALSAQNSCTVTQADITSIQAIQNDPSLTYNQGTAKELEARKFLLTRIITCAKADVESLRKSLTSGAASGSEAQNIKNQLLSKLDDATNYYQLQQGKLEDVGITGTEQIAKEVLAWRATNLAPLGDQINNFLLWSKNQALFETASARMSKISRIASFLSTNNNELAAAFAAAQASFENALNQNIAARKAIAQSLSDQEVSSLIQQSLKSLSETYESFFTVSTVIQGLTPSK